jgi:hypothetical protein
MTIADTVIATIVTNSSVITIPTAILGAAMMTMIIARAMRIATTTAITMAGMGTTGTADATVTTGIMGAMDTMDTDISAGIATTITGITMDVGMPMAGIMAIPVSALIPMTGATGIRTSDTKSRTGTITADKAGFQHESRHMDVPGTL